MNSKKDIVRRRDKNLNSFRELIAKILLSKPSKVYISKECDEDGDLEFFVSYKDFGITVNDLNKFESDVLSSHFANFVGELLIRENINDFMAILTAFDSKEYNYKVNRFTHDNFGVRFEKGKMYFKFHLSFIQKMITENFKELIGHDYEAEEAR